MSICFELGFHVEREWIREIGIWHCRYCGLVEKPAATSDEIITFR